MPSTTELHKQAAIKAIDALFANTSAPESEQIDALQEIKERCEENIATLREQTK